MTSPPQPDLLLVSDMHLGDPHRGDRSGAFARWLDHHRTHRRPDRHWRLLLNGDTLEFLNLAPAPGTAARKQPPSMRGACRKLARIADLARPAFDALGRFLADGHEVHFIIGNHDRELLLRPVRRMLRRLLTRASQVKRRYRRAVRRRVIFHPWFYLEPGVLYVEHGHQLDEYSSYTDILAPNPGGKAGELEEPVSHLATRVFVYEAQGVFDLDNVETWQLVHYLRWGAKQGLRRSLRLASLYFQMLVGVFAQALKRVAWKEKPTPRVRRELEGHRVRYGIEFHRMLDLRRLWRPPAQLWGVMQCFLVDRLLLVVGVTAASVAFFLGFGAGLTTAVAIPSTIAVAATAWWLLSRLRILDLGPRMEEAAHRIRQIVGVPIVAFGHTHTPVCQPLDGSGTWYLNPGGWMTSDEAPRCIVLQRTAEGGLAVDES